MYNKYVYANQKVLGQMDEVRLTELQKFYVSNGVVPKETAAKELYTNQFVVSK
jgi:NitT/TauT family transport system substrate-binding protein